MKLFRPSLLDEVTAAMDRATAAAEKAGDRARLANLIAARGESLDVVLLNGIAYEAYRAAPDRNPTGPASGSHKVLRGGSSLYDERFSRCAARMTMPPHVRDWTPTGFRCTMDAPSPDAPVSHDVNYTTR